MRLFSKYIWRFSIEKKEIYLTFDDGPTPEITQFVLDELNKYNAKATFFCIGKNIKNQPAIFKRIIAEKHSVGNHTQNHLNGWKTSKKEYVDNFLECDSIISSTVEKPQKKQLFRPPYGKLKKKQAEKILKKGYKIIMWSVLSADFDTSITKEECLENVLQNTTNGSIVVFHDSVKASKKLRFTLPKVLAHFSKKGYAFKAIQ
ncbi:polysaccharide deacetylase family protein [Polaribacter sp.]|uniref:polysaccharide deacetylase family protein n=1 Tax=Polaribacter sp. TaxID=1920175 RepID=UPI003F6B7E8B